MLSLILALVLLPLRVLLFIVTYVIRHCLRRNALPPPPPADAPRQRVVVLGAGFAGLFVARELAAHSKEDKTDVLLVSAAEYVEYVPGILRALVDPAHADTLQSPLTEELAGCAVLFGVVESIHYEGGGGGGGGKSASGGRGHVLVRSRYSEPGSPPTSVPFDALVVATGSTYSAPIKGDPGHVATLAQRQAQIAEGHADLASSKSVVILGGGPVGVELAAEIVHRWGAGGAGAGAGASKGKDAKEVTIVTLSPTLLEGMEAPVVEAAERWLRERGVRIVASDRIVGFAPGVNGAVRPGRQSPAGSATVRTERGLELRADYIYSCIGARPASDYAVSSSPSVASARLPNGKIVVDEALRIQGCGGRIFALGDVAAPPYRDPDVGHTAEKQAMCVSASVRALVRSRDGPRDEASPIGSPAALRYPADVPGKGASAVVFAISLGPNHGLVAFNQFSITGRWVGQRLGGLMKWFIEVSKVSQMRGQWWGVGVWEVADFGAEMTSKFVFKPKPRAPAQAPAPVAAAPAVSAAGRASG
jgi:NADH dehydrogenase FAD-containing subunit